jgi:hypothetical protein
MASETNDVFTLNWTGLSGSSATSFVLIVDRLRFARDDSTHADARIVFWTEAQVEFACKNEPDVR